MKSSEHFTFITITTILTCNYLVSFRNYTMFIGRKSANWLWELASKNSSFRRYEWTSLHCPYLSNFW